MQTHTHIDCSSSDHVWFWSFIENISINSASLSPQVFLCVLCLLATLLPAASSCPPPCLCYSDGLVDCRGRGLSSLPPLHLLPPGSHSLLLANNKLSSLGASAFANLSSLEVCSVVLWKFWMRCMCCCVLVYTALWNVCFTDIAYLIRTEWAMLILSQVLTNSPPTLEKLTFSRVCWGSHH